MQLILLHVLWFALDSVANWAIYVWHNHWLALYLSTHAKLTDVAPALCNMLFSKWCKKPFTVRRSFTFFNVTWGILLSGSWHSTACIVKTDNYTKTCIWCTRWWIRAKDFLICRKFNFMTKRDPIASPTAL